MGRRGRDALPVTRLPLRLVGDAGRTITRFFWPGSEERAGRIIDRVLALDRATVSRLLAETVETFGGDHRDFDATLVAHFEELARRVPLAESLPDESRLLVGACFTMEYAFESAALFNPSMVLSRFQDDLPPGCKRFAISLRAVGEGHVSSVVFREGIIDADGLISVDAPGRFCHPVRADRDVDYEKQSLRLCAQEAETWDPCLDGVFAQLGDRFDMQELLRAMGEERPAGPGAERFNQAAAGLIALARSNYRIRGDRATRRLSELVLFPVSESESGGMEDMRLVRFRRPDGSILYYGTYTAYDGRRILPRLFEMYRADEGRMHTLGGRFAQNKGLALFPRMVGGRYAMIARVDGENTYLAWSDNILVWKEGRRIQKPEQPWEIVQVGNCGSPIETDAGWLLLTHGVGPMRRYCIGAVLLDLADPTRVIGRLDEPLLAPEADESTGYVPNVVYSCGSMVHNGTLVIPYGISDAATGFATVPMDALLERLVP